jgi:hypothetical protein
MSWSAPGLLTGPEISLKRSHLGRAAAEEGFGRRSPVDLVAEGTVKSLPPLSQPMPAFALRLGYGQSELLR